MNTTSSLEMWCKKAFGFTSSISNYLESLDPYLQDHELHWILLGRIDPEKPVEIYPLFYNAFHMLTYVNKPALGIP